MVSIKDDGVMAVTLQFPTPDDLMMEFGLQIDLAHRLCNAKEEKKPLNLAP